MSKGKESTDKVKVFHTGNPHLTCVFLNDTTLVACGYDKIPYVYKLEGNDWKMTKNMDDAKTKRPARVTGKTRADDQVYFSHHKLNNDVGLTEFNTKHLNYINCL